MGIFRKVDDKQKARRTEAATKRKEAAADRKRMNLKKQEAQIETYKQHGGHGIILFENRSCTNTGKRTAGKKK